MKNLGAAVTAASVTLLGADVAYAGGPDYWWIKTQWWILLIVILLILNLICCWRKR